MRLLDDVLGADLNWVSPDAACTQQGDIDQAFFATTGRGYHRARRICSTCPLSQPCLEYALTHDVYGLWAGTSVKDRNRIKAGKPLDPPKTATVRALKPCGTRAAYRRHIANGEPVDQACTEAATAHSRTYRERRS